MTLTTVLEVIISALVITAGAELLVRGASALALRLGVSPLFVGLTIVGFGTSSPELGASVSATLGGSPGISVGNVVGSNIFNIAVILGLTAILSPIPIVFDRIHRDLYVAIAAAMLPLVAYFAAGEVSRPMGIVSLCILAAYLFNAYRRDKHASKRTVELAKEEVESTLAIASTPRPSTLILAVHALCVILGLGMLIVGSTRFVHGATEIAKSLGMSDVVIGLTLVAVGTSLPELVTSVVAAYRKSSDIAVGNILGSNIFNLLGILGVCAVIAPQPLTAQTVFIDVPIMLALSLLLLPVLKSGGIVSRKEGAFLLAAYTAYCAFLIVSATKS